MPYAAAAHGRLEGLDYRAERPFKGWRRPQLISEVHTWLNADPPRLELATLVLDELNLRQRRRDAGKIELLFGERGLRPVPWLSEAHRVAISQMPISAGRGSNNVYAILRAGYTEASQFYGVYVGATGKPVEERYREHRTGYRSGAGLKTHGIELLYSLFDWANPIPNTTSSRNEMESQLHRILETVVRRVSGDVPANVVTAR